MIRVMVSACLLGENVRYDGRILPLRSAIIAQWMSEGRVLGFCPEVKGGLPIPRPSAEIVAGDGHSVINSDAIVLNHHGQDVTGYFINGAVKAFLVAQEKNVKLAVLKDRSPSCGSTSIYDGSFSRSIRPGKGVTAALLENNNIKVFHEGDLKNAATYLKTLENLGK